MPMLIKQMLGTDKTSFIRSNNSATATTLSLSRVVAVRVRTHYTRSYRGLYFKEMRGQFGGMIDKLMYGVSDHPEVGVVPSLLVLTDTIASEQLDTEVTASILIIVTSTMVFMKVSVWVTPEDSQLFGSKHFQDEVCVTTWVIKLVRLQLLVSSSNLDWCVVTSSPVGTSTFIYHCCLHLSQ